MNQSAAEGVVIRAATLQDAPSILAIYAYYVQHTAISFEYDVPTAAAFTQRMQRIMEQYPYLVAERSGTIVGYAYAAPFIGRAAYRWSCETTIYLDHRVKKQGIGKMLYTVLEEKLKGMGVQNLYACIGLPCAAYDPYITTNSAGFHAHIGYRQVGVFRKCGNKFNRWYDMVWMEKIIGSHPQYEEMREKL